ncbi:MAG: hypothetical protein MMC23_001196 [Stictis urceolatum]|nr:hypothetical protein [Stictis urceolata]
MPHPVFVKSSTALITGGCSGVGLAVAKLCASHGMRLALVDYNKENISAAKSSFDSGTDVETYEADVSKIDTWKDLKQKIEKRFGGLNFLMLNAGIGAKGTWEDTDYFYKIMDTNLFGVVNGISTFLPQIQSTSSSGPTAIVITGSKQGITNPPGNMAYNASKSAVKALAEHLSFDLRNTSTSVHLLVPGWTFTGLTGGGAIKEKPAGAWAPEQVAGFLAKKMADGQFYVLCPDNDVTEDKDRRRMLWAMGDAVEGRPPLSRWREDWKDKAQKGINDMKLP